MVASGESVWSVASEPLHPPKALDIEHYAPFPTEWPRRIIAGWAPTCVCIACGEPRRVTAGPEQITGYSCGCSTPDAETTPAVVLDPFGGSGTTAMVARALGRYGVSLDLSADYLRLAQWRVFESGHGRKALDRTHGK